MDFRFTTEESVRRADEICDYLRGPRLWIPRTDYPDFDIWLDRAHPQIKREEKRAVVAISNGGVVGVVLYQQHRDLPSVLEVKNISVQPDFRGRHFAAFLLRNAEIEGRRDYGSSLAMVDAKAGNTGIRRLLMDGKYRPLRTTDLYGLGSGADTMYVKQISDLYPST